MNKHYGRDAIWRSLGHFLLGKTFRLVTSLTIFLILVRNLPLEQYAVHISFNAVLFIVGVLTSFGVQKIMFRYLPELRATGNNIAAYRLLFWGMMFRTFVVSAMFAAMLPFIPQIAEAFNFQAWVALFPLYLVMSYFRLTALWLSQSLESFLWQKESQYSLALGGLVSAGLMIALVMTGNLELRNVILAELAGELTSLALLLIGWTRRWFKDRQRDEGDRYWWRDNKRRVIRYGAWSYALNQSALGYGSAPNRLVAAHFLGVADTAVLGAADNMMNLARKLVPTRMFMSMVRPLAMARFASSGDFQAVAAISESVFRMNLILLVFPISILAVVGPELMGWITNGKYAEAGYLLMGFLFVLIAEGLRSLVELMVQALEKNPIFFWTNLAQSASLVIAVPLLPLIGLWGLVVANLVGTVMANSIVIGRLRRQGFGFRIYFDLVAWIFVHGAVASLAGWTVWQVFPSLGLTVAAVTLIYVVLTLLNPPLLPAERLLVQELADKKLRRRKRPAPVDVAVKAAKSTRP